MAEAEQEPEVKIAEAKQSCLTRSLSCNFCLRKRPEALYREKTIYDTWGSYEKDGVRYNSLCKDRGGVLITVPDDSPTTDTVWKLFQHGLGISPKSNCLGWREGDSYKWWSYEQVTDQVRALSQALTRQRLKRQDKVGIYSASKPDWLITALAVTVQSLVIVPLYDTLGTDSCSYIINQVQMELLFVDTPAAARKIITNSSSMPTLRTVVCFEEPDEVLIQLAEQDHGKRLISVKKFVEEAGKEDADKNKSESNGENSNICFYDLPVGEDIFVIMYTSGTTGDPKGVVHRHRGVVSNVVSIDSFFWCDRGNDLKFSEKDICLHYLPLAHAYGLLCACWFLYRGSSIGFFSGNVIQLAEDAQVLRPTFVPMVPRLMNRVYSKILGGLEKSPMKAKLFWYAYRKKKAGMEKGVVTRSSIWDKLVFHKAQANLGGRVWFMSVGSAPVSKEVLEFFRIVFGCLFIEGYGQTECSAGATLAMGPVGGNVGHSLPCNCVKLTDVPECGYIVGETGRGEVCIKGENVMVEYYKQPEKTAEALDADGWLHTGDIGEFLEDGSLKIVDRKKNIFKLAQGEYIAPEKIENVYAMCPKISQCFVDGNSLESFTVAIVVPEPIMAAEYATENGIAEIDLPKNSDFVQMIFQAMVSVGKENKLNSLEQVKAIHVTKEQFTIENGLITPTLKNKRPELRKKFRDEIEALYKAGPMAVEAAKSTEEKGST